MNYGVPYTPAYAPAYTPGYPMSPYRSYGIGAEVPPPATAEPTTMDKAKAWLNDTTFNVPRKYLLGGAAALGGIYYAYNAGWFGPTGMRRAARRR
jgi:hypothetical protein